MVAPGSGAFDLADLCGLDYHVVTTWTDEMSNVLTLTQDVNSNLVSDTLRTVQCSGTWSGNCQEVPLDNSLTVDPLHELWYQAGPGHMQVTYTEVYRLSGVPHTLHVVKDLTYTGGGSLPFSESFNVTNISATNDTLAQTQHDSDDLSLTQVPGTPIWDPRMAWVALFAVVGLGSVALWKRADR